MTDQHLTFHGDAIPAARHVLEQTSLAHLWGDATSSQPIRVTNHGQTLAVDIYSLWRFSSGEQTLLRLLTWLADIDMTHLDEHTARVALTALTLRFGGEKALARLGGGA